MYAPIPIRATLMQPAHLETLCQLLKEHPFKSRWSVTATVWSVFNFFDVKGNPRRQSCLSALTALERSGAIC